MIVIEVLFVLLRYMLFAVGDSGWLVFGGCWRGEFCFCFEVLFLVGGLTGND